MRQAWQAWAGAAAALVLAAAGCGSSPSGAAGGAAAGAQSPSQSTRARPSGSAATSAASAHGWSKDRLLSAIAKHPGTTHTAKAGSLNGLVGAVFTHDSGGDHFCTASVVDSAGQNLIITAAHCVYDPVTGQGSDLVFVPGYRNGETPNGVWPIVSITVDQSWKDNGNPDLDVAFAIVQPQNGLQVQQVLGANTLGVNLGYQLPVRVTGYPSSGDVPITCSNNTTQQSPTQLRIDCPDYTGGTSGSPWITALDPKTRSGTVVGVIGGYQQGGDTPDTSYTSYFGDQVQALYARATG
ncbi:trypsin-like serine protease [Kitasatospora sp. MAP5-34]|uniref:trypsin-like serine peptidase n=1 Tax=Kitasatospora sp. MAP5-34 TaxID=3035102 RepID=UPI002476874E|nr:trypsin-like serine protease [Kitasatospora sp. MAP5-34]